MSGDVVELADARTVRDLRRLDEAADHLDECSVRQLKAYVLAEQEAEVLRGDSILPTPPTQPISVRVAPETVDDLARLADELGNVSRSKVASMALGRGIEVLRAELDNETKTHSTIARFDEIASRLDLAVAGVVNFCSHLRAQHHAKPGDLVIVDENPAEEESSKPEPDPRQISISLPSGPEPSEEEEKRLRRSNRPRLKGDRRDGEPERREKLRAAEPGRRDADLIREWRENHDNVSMSKAAKMAGISPSAWSRGEAGIPKGMNPKIRALIERG